MTTSPSAARLVVTRKGLLLLARTVAVGAIWTAPTRKLHDGVAKRANSAMTRHAEAAMLKLYDMTSLIDASSSRTEVSRPNFAPPQQLLR